ncbi:TetR/AcrR family transcriptional regulator [Mycobacterium sp. TY814]|uniref:TetR/AcrR family transcriptional regulator n=1 Tax=unclassified Mycobacterium TaxID=2642494 RepID=UPI0027411BBF|nr:TetR/AcrR family transcriptional regulator [Mycobacterium sp. TY814]MDP7726178.1 TetR/AcrR family transcriptional regulator [Mycobacterium sp. TY814]
MPADDWVIGADRRAMAAERIYAAATDLIARHGLDALDIDMLAANVHCSRATVYRYAGGKAEIRDAVLRRAAAGIIDSVRSAVAGLSGQERVVTAITLALKRIRSDPMSRLMLSSGADAMGGLTASPLLADLASELAGLADTDPQAAQWVVRVVLSLVSWPAENAAAEHELVQRFVAPAFGDKP